MLPFHPFCLSRSISSLPISLPQNWWAPFSQERERGERSSPLINTLWVLPRFINSCCLFSSLFFPLGQGRLFVLSRLIFSSARAVARDRRWRTDFHPWVSFWGPQGSLCFGCGHYGVKILWGEIWGSRGSNHQQLGKRSRISRIKGFEINDFGKKSTILFRSGFSFLNWREI